MNKGVLNLSILLLGFRFIFIFSNVYSQDHKLTRKERFEIRKAQNVSNFESLNSLIESKKFSYILGENEYNKLLPWQKRENPKLPYIMMIDSSYAILFLDSPYHIKEGNIENWNLKKNFKKLCLYLQFKMIGPSPFWDIDFYFTINSDNSAHLRIKYMEGENSRFGFPSYGRIVKNDSSIIQN